ncbi:unnamed protein product [Calicophoron daubneyi]|uniref:CWH43-like N-terminal domain-containing protein n=2 Tax=Calicophoron daubneyi TaxID=300641 RepID=A0AAV2TXQ5_CALDB
MGTCTLKYLPICLVALMVCTFIISYSMSAYSGNVSVLFPYISDTGTLVPASCVFGQLVNMCAFLGALCVYAWHLHEMYRIEHNECPRLHRTFARITLILGLLCALGFSMVGNFQETSVMIGHLIGAMMTFVSGILFCAVLSFSSRVHLGSPTWLWVLRSILTFINATCFIFVFVFGALSGEMRLPPRKYEGTEKGYVYHALSVSCEWAQVTVLMIFSSQWCMNFEISH